MRSGASSDAIAGPQRAASAGMPMVRQASVVPSLRRDPHDDNYANDAYGDADDSHSDGDSNTSTGVREALSSAVTSPSQLSRGQLSRAQQHHVSAASSSSPLRSTRHQLPSQPASTCEGGGGVGNTLEALSLSRTQEHDHERPGSVSRVGAYNLFARFERLRAFMASREARVFSRAVKYEVRATFASSRARTNGRFVPKTAEPTGKSMLKQQRRPSRRVPHGDVVDVGEAIATVPAGDTDSTRSA